MEVEAIKTLLQDQGLAIFFVLALIEGPIVTVIAGALAAAGIFDPVAMLAVAVAGDLAGDGVIYGLGRFFPKLARRVFGPRMPRQPAGLQDLFARRGGWLLFIGKFTHVAGFAVILTAGFARMPMGKFAVFSVLASVPKVLALAGLGWVFGLSLGVDDLGWIAVLAVVLAGAALLALSVWRRRCVSA